MKKILVAIGILAMCSSAAFGDEVDEGLPGGVSERIRTNTREMIRLGANSDEAVRMTRLMVNSRFQEENTVRAQETVMKGLKEGLPAEPVMNKAFEGMAKGVRAEDVVKAMETTRHRYSYAYSKARDIVGEDGEFRGIGDTMAEGMAAGLKPEDADRVVEKLRAQDRDRTRDRSRDGIDALARETFTAVREMTRRGVSSETAADAVSLALENGYRQREMEMLRHSFMQQSQQEDPQRIAERYCRAIRTGSPSENLGSGGGYGESGSGHGSGAGTQGGNATGGAGAGASHGSGSGGGDSGGSSGSGSGGSSGGGAGGSSGGGSGHGGGGSGKGK